MSGSTTALTEFLQSSLAPRRDQPLPCGATRRKLEKSELLLMMQAACQAINREAEQAIIDVHHYLPPEPVVSSFTMCSGSTEYVMRLELWNDRPQLVFLTRRWKTNILDRLVRALLPFFDSNEISVSKKLSLLLKESGVTTREVEEWFVYLLSGLKRMYRPRRAAAYANDRRQCA